MNDECSDEDNELERERKQEDIKNDKSVKSEGNTSNEEVQDETEDVEGCEDDEDCYVKENTLMEGASVVKYSVKTTPFLQRLIFITLVLFYIHLQSVIDHFLF